MRRHMQNISFLAIIATLLSCAFFFSQQTQPKTTDEPKDAETAPKTLKDASLDDLPDCESEIDLEDSLTCYTQAAVVTANIVDERVDEILAQETDSGRRMDFLESQLAWEKSRDADCAFEREMAADPELQDLQENTCQYNHNLARLNELGQTLCEYYQSTTCPDPISP
jgi:uncharacterized protein YecT (DUF1311 family)